MVMDTTTARTRPPFPHPVKYSKNQVRRKMKATKKRMRAADFHLLREICSYMADPADHPSEEWGHVPEAHVPIYDAFARIRS